MHRSLSRLVLETALAPGANRGQNFSRRATALLLLDRLPVIQIDSRASAASPAANHRLNIPPRARWGINE